MRCAIWYHLYNLKNVKNTHGRVLLLVKLQATKSNTHPWVFFMFFSILQMVPNRATHHIWLWNIRNSFGKIFFIKNFILLPFEYKIHRFGNLGIIPKFHF